MSIRLYGTSMSLLKAKAKCDYCDSELDDSGAELCNLTLKLDFIDPMGPISAERIPMASNGNLPP
jgi:hypothetical protein